VGPRFSNPLVDRIHAPSNVLPANGGLRLQLVWEGDLAQAFYLAVKSDAPGPFNVGTEDSITGDELADIHGQRVRRMPAKLAGPIAETLFRLRLSPVSSHWVISGEGVVSPEHAREELGWQPRFSSAEAARMLLVQRGRPILPGRSAHVFARKDVAEEALEGLNAALETWSQSVPGLRRVLDGPGDLSRMIERVEHVLLPHEDKQLHLEVQKAGDEEPTIVFSPGIGGYGRVYLPLLGKLCDAGFNTVAMDRPGHGLSEGRRGDCTIDQILDVVENTIRYARERFGGPVALVGSSLGGIISWYALTREPDVEAVVCHNLYHPAVFHERFARLKSRLLARLARVAPFAPVPIKQLANFEKLSSSPEILDYFRRELDGIWCWSITARSAASIFDYDPPVDWTRVKIPALALVGAEDEMVSAPYTREAFGAAHPPTAELRLLPGAGHLLFHDHLDEALGEVVDWLRAALRASENVPALAAEER
jgi:pimeloyl-ACP methyl ester carboxylesterase